MSLYLEPISRHLLPYFTRNLYRQIRLSSYISWLKLLDRVASTPVLGDFVQELDVSSLFLRAHRVSLVDVIEPFPRLVSLKSGYIDSIGGSSLSPPSTMKALSYQCAELRSGDIEILSRFPHLDQLEIRFATMELEPDSSPSFFFSKLDKLILSSTSRTEEDSVIWADNLARFLQLFPNLTELTLCDARFPYYGAALPHLTHLFTRIVSLRLNTDEADDDFGLSCNHFLPLFVNLEHLYLAKGTVSPALAVYLGQLPRLSSLHLGNGTHILGPSSDELLSLLDSQPELPNLKEIVLDCLHGRIGHRMDSEDVLIDEEEIAWDDFRGWKYPRFTERFEVEHIRELSALGIQRGIEVSGGAVDAVAVWDAYHLELANRKVLRAFMTKSRDVLDQLQNRTHHLDPVLDFGRLNPRTMNVIKNDLPKEEWFALSLK